MDVNYFKKELASILEISIDKLSINDELSKFESWDSLAMMSVVVIFREKSSNEIDPIKVSQCNKVSDLLDLVK